MTGLLKIRWMLLLATLCPIVCSAAAQDRAGWYPAKGSATIPGFTAGAKGKPFQAKATWTTHGRDPKYGDFYTRSTTVDLMRDAAGRERMSWPVPVGDARVSKSDDLMTVLLLDPVARCLFLWIETKAGNAANSVKVRCEPEETDTPERPSWNALSDGERNELAKEPESKPHFEDTPLGTEQIGGVPAKGFRHEEVRTFDSGTRVEREDLGQRWYSPELDMVVRATQGDANRYLMGDQVSFSISDIKLGEPPQGNFAPPAKAAIEVDPNLTLVARTTGRRYYSFQAARLLSGSEFSWPNLDLMATTDQAERLVHPAFPESWYADGPTTPMPTFFQGAAGKPFDALGVLMQFPPTARTSSDATETVFLNVARDSAGRSRFTFRFLNGGPGEMVYIMDPVAGCIFQWNELSTWESNRAQPSSLVAKVRCNARGVPLPPPPRWDEPNNDEKAQIAKEGADNLHFVNERIGQETIGERGGPTITAIRYAHYAVHTGDNGKLSKVKLSELSYSPDLDTVVKIAVAPTERRQRSSYIHGDQAPTDSKKSDQQPDFLPLLELNSITAGEPLEEFYPPHGYEIKLDESLLPPFAPAPTKATEPK